MAFKFVAKNRETGRTGAVTVKAASEESARQKLRLGGYEVVRLMRVNNGREGSIELQIKSVSVESTPKNETNGFCAAIRSLITRIDNAFYYG